MIGLAGGCSLMRNFWLKPLPDCEETEVGGVGWRGVLHYSKTLRLKLPFCLIFRRCEYEGRDWSVQLFDTFEKAQQFMDNLDNEIFGEGGVK